MEGWISLILSQRWVFELVGSLTLTRGKEGCMVLHPCYCLLIHEKIIKQLSLVLTPLPRSFSIVLEMVVACFMQLNSLNLRLIGLNGITPPVHVGRPFALNAPSLCIIQRCVKVWWLGDNKWRCLRLSISLVFRAYTRYLLL